MMSRRRKMMKTGRSNKKATAVVKNITIIPANCLFCARRCSNGDNHPCTEFFGNNDNNNKKGLLLPVPVDDIKTEPGQQPPYQPGILFTESSGSDGVLLQGHLRAIFVLRQVLRLSPEQVAVYLSKNNGSLNPDGWFSLCSSCDSAVRECFTLQRRLVQVERKLEVAKLALVNLIYSTGTEQKRRIKKRRQGQEGHQDLAFDIRQTVLKDLSISQEEETGAASSNCKIKISPGVVTRKCSNNTTTVKTGGGAETRRHQKKRRIRRKKTLGSAKVESGNGGGGKVGRRKSCRKQGTSQKYDQQSMEFDTIPESCPPPEPLDSEASRDAHSFDDVDEPFEIMGSPGGSNKTNDSSGSDWKPSDVDDDDEPDSENEQEQYVTTKAKFRQSAPLSPNGSVVITNNESLDETDRVPNPTTTTTSKSLQVVDTGVQDLPSRTRYTYKCAICPATFSTKGRLSAHSKLHDQNHAGDGEGGGGGGVTCSKCGWLVSKASLDDHTSRYCTSKFPRLLKRNYLNKSYQRFSYKMKTKTLSITDGIPYYCDHCHMIFPQESTLVSHCRIYHSDKLLTTSCQYCEGDDASAKFFVSKQLLRIHTEATHSKEERLVRERQGDDDGGPAEPETGEDVQPKTCPHCPELFPSTMKLDFHIAQRHKHDGLLTCSTCQYRARNYGQLCTHLRAHQRRTVRWGKKANGRRRIIKSRPAIIKTEETNVIPDNPSSPTSPPSLDTTTPTPVDDTKPSRGGSIPIPTRLAYTYRCTACPAKYRSKNRLSTHLKLHEEHEGVGGVVGAAGCPQCKWLIPKESLGYHMKRSCPARVVRRRRKRNAFTDKPKKPKTYKYNYKLETVTGAEVDEIPYYCDHCHMIFTRKYLLHHHYHTHHAGTAFASCNSCPSNFVSKQLLELHIKAMHSASAVDLQEPPPPPPEHSQPQSCPHCSETTSFPSKLKLDFHIAKVHREALLTCPNCGFKAPKYSAFVAHSRTHLDIQEKLLACHFCGAQLGSKGSLASHMKSNHAEELGLEEILCPICGVNFPTKVHLRNHTEHVHEKKKDHFCEFCGKAFSRTCDLKKHLLLHTAPRELQYKKGPFPCQYCDSKFNVRQGLYYHLKREHSDKYRFRCDKCGKGYCSKATLTPHQRDCKGTGGTTTATTPPPPPVQASSLSFNSSCAAAASRT